jgi:outer membrane receptor protein involved in Fe transport
LNPRNLGANRVLVLMDGQRMAGANNAGTVDVSQIPSSLIQRVDIVTGGASASWGSDAVSGVVNFVLDNRFTGFKANLNAGITTYWDDPTGQISLAAGHDLFGDRGHVVFSADLTYDDGIRHNGDRPWYTAEKVIPRSIAATPAGDPQYIRSSNVYETQVSPGGIITAGPLKGIQFGPGGRPEKFVYGSYVVDPFQIGGTPVDLGTDLDLASKYTRTSMYGRFTYDVTDKVNLWVSGMYAAVDASVDPMPHIFNIANLTIQCDNAFLPAEIAAACATNKITSFQFGTSNEDFGSLTNFNFRVLRRFAAGGAGDFNMLGSTWSWDAYWAHAENHIRTTSAGQRNNTRYTQAIDAIRAPTGEIICRSAAARADGCVPLNIIGTGVASPSAIYWVQGSGLQSITHRYRKQDAGSLSLNGKPFSLWAGPVSLATGFEYRKESYDSPSVDPFGTVLSTASGSFDVAEAFLETGIPLIDSDVLGQAELSLAARREKYSTAGYVTAWKAGLTYETPIPGLRFRGLQSRDIRAPNLDELFAPIGTGTGGGGNTVVDRFPPNDGKTFTVPNISGGNPNLKPETSDNKQVGVVYQPEWFPGLRTSVDYWNITIEGGISQLTPQQTIDVCFRGNATICNGITRNAAGTLTTISTQLVNLASVKTDGFDYEVAYNRPLEDLIPGSWLDGLEGQFSARLLATNIKSFVEDAGIPGLPVRNTAGQLQGSQSTQTAQHWRIRGTQSINFPRWGLALTERWTSSGVIGVDYIECTSGCPAPTDLHGTINNNHVPSTFYMDLGGNFNVTKNVESYFKIDNIADSPPTLAPVFNGRTNIAANGATGELLGRRYTIGLRLRY